MSRSETFSDPCIFTTEILEGWSLSPEGAAIHRDEKTAVIADVHLGYEWARASGGDMIPAHSLGETIAKLDRLFSSATISRLVVAGDLVETSAPCARTLRDFHSLIDWLESRSVQFQWVRGNHDPSRRPALPLSMIVDGWTIRHGDRPIRAGRAIFGHHHPALRAAGLTAPCFLIGRETIALPAFTPNAAGLDVASSAIPKVFRREPLRCIAGVGQELLDFGLLDELVRRLRR